MKFRMNNVVMAGSAQGIALWALMVVTGFSASVHSAAAGPQKKGVGYWAFAGTERGLKNSGVSWCYDWGPRPVSPRVEGIEFVPMIWGEINAGESDMIAAKESGSVLLGFNEPDHKDQANMTIERALMLWPRLEATGMRLGSPATAGDASSPGGWFDRFMQGAAAGGNRVDFICVHHYCPDYTDAAAATENLRRYLQRVYDMYGKPVWLTEFALANWKTPAAGDAQEAYIRAALPMLESLPFVERYAWFALPPVKGGEGWLAQSHLCDDDGTLNARGNAYRDAK